VSPILAFVDTNDNYRPVVIRRTWRFEFNHANFGVNRWGDGLKCGRYNTFAQPRLQGNTHNGKNRLPCGRFIYANQDVPTVGICERRNGLFKVLWEIHLVVKNQPFSCVGLAKVAHILKRKSVNRN